MFSSDFHVNDVGDGPGLGLMSVSHLLLNEDMSDKPFLFQFQHGRFLFVCWEDEEPQEAVCLLCGVQLLFASRVGLCEWSGAADACTFRRRLQASNSLMRCGLLA